MSKPINPLNYNVNFIKRVLKHHDVLVKQIFEQTLEKPDTQCALHTRHLCAHTIHHCTAFYNF